MCCLDRLTFYSEFLPSSVRAPCMILVVVSIVSFNIGPNVKMLVSKNNDTKLCTGGEACCLRLLC